MQINAPANPREMALTNCPAEQRLERHVGQGWEQGAQVGLCKEVVLGTRQVGQCAGHPVTKIMAGKSLVKEIIGI